MKAVVKVIAGAILVAFAVASLSACNTIRGMGRDIERGGEKIQEATD